MPSYSTMDKLKLLKGYQDSEASLKVYADTHAVYDRTLKRWIKQFLLYDWLAFGNEKAIIAILSRLKSMRSKTIRPGFHGHRSWKSMRFAVLANLINGRSSTIKMS